MKHVLPRLLRPEAPGGTWTSGKTGRGRKEGGGITLTLEDEILSPPGMLRVLTDSVVTMALNGTTRLPPQSHFFSVRQAYPASLLSPCLCLCL